MEATSDSGTECLDEHLEADFEKVTVDCEESFDDFKRTVQGHLWSSYGSDELAAAFEEVVEHANSIAADTANCEAYEINIALLERLKKLFYIGNSGFHSQTRSTSLNNSGNQ